MCDLTCWLCDTREVIFPIIKCVYGAGSYLKVPRQLKVSPQTTNFPPNLEGLAVVGVGRRAKGVCRLRRVQLQHSR